MRKKTIDPNVNSNDIELPLLSSKANPVSSTKSKSKFLDFFNTDSSPSKYIQKLPFLQFITLSDIWPLLKIANNKKGSLTIDDLPKPFAFYNIEKKIIALDEAWTESIERGKPSFAKAIFKAYKKEIILIIFFAFLLISAKIASVVIMNWIMGNITNNNLKDSSTFQDTLILTILLTLTSTIIVFSATWVWHLGAVIAANMKNAITGYTYRKLQSVALSTLQEVNIGKVINLLSNDMNEIERDLIFLVPLVISPYTIILGGIIIWSCFEYSAIFGIANLVSSLLLSHYISKKTIALRSEKKGMTDARIKLTNELIECVRLIKMYAWEKFFKQAIITLRQNEALRTVKLKAYEAIGKSVAESSVQSSLVIMCLIYVGTGGILSPQKIYTSLMALNFVGLWGMNFSHQGLMFFGTFKVIMQRLENLLLVKEISNLGEVSRGSVSLQEKESRQRISPEIPVPPMQRSTISFQEYSAWWNKEAPKPCLDNISLTLYPGRLTTVIGTIGSGKTSFLLSLLREIPITQGNLKSSGTLAYVEQEPIIFSGTIRSNILFGLEYDENLYKRVVRACNLHEDFKQFDAKDMTIVGERGTTLSGGQKARVSLARALYSQSDIYLLDDPLSAVDSKVGRHIFKYAIRGDLLKDKIVLLVTHHLNYAKESDRVLLFSEGAIVADGPFESIRTTESGLFTKFAEVEDEEKKRNNSERRSSVLRGVSELIGDGQEIQKQEDMDSKETDAKVTWSTYFNYVKQNKNLTLMILVLLCYAIYGMIVIVFSRFLGYWGQAHSSFYLGQDAHDPGKQFDNTFYIIWSIVLLLGVNVAYYLQMVLTNRFLIQANSNMHHKILSKIIRAPSVFFDKTPVGTILNRFSNDLGVLDTSNAAMLAGIFDGLIYITFRIITLIIIDVTLLFPIVIIFTLVSKIKVYFQKLILEVKRIDLASRSPLYSEISATINGLLAIRAFNQSGTFIRRFCELLYTNFRAALYVDRAQRFLAFVLTSAFESLTIIGTFICVIIAYYTDLEAGLFGLTLLLLGEISNYGGWFIRTSLLVDINMQSVDRIFKIYEIEQEAPKHAPAIDDSIIQKLSTNLWPHNGQLTFNNVYLKYRPEFDHVLRGLSFNIQGAEKVGIIGRTGAGKSSIIQALFRMTEIDIIPGSNIQIDGQDISKLGLNLLRESLSIIPQTPVVFTGTIKRNLDPFQIHSDRDLWKMLEEVNLKNYVESLENKLDTDMTLSSSVFSAGQKQLVCLARAILRKSKIIVLDEATANVDIETDDFIQKAIMEKFKESTVITIAHRLITIANYDRVLVMDKGRMIEYDVPYRLLVKELGDEDITNTESVFAQMVKASGESTAKKIFSVAKSKFYEK